MTDNTLTVRDHSKPCKHRGAVLAVQYRKDDPRWYTCPDPSCPGGREIVLTLWGHVQYDGPAIDLVASDEEWDVALYTLEVSDV